MTPLPLVVPDTDNTRRRIVEALAWAGGIRRDDIALVSAEARTHWHILADHALTELRLLSVTHRDGLEDAEVGAILRRAQQAEANRDFDRQQYERRLDELRAQHAASLDALQRADAALAEAGRRVMQAAAARRKTVRVDQLLDGLPRVVV